MKLVIVESPAKCNTIQRYLGDDYLVKASLGHIRDLATSGKGGLGVDVEHGFTPTYIINKDKVKVTRELIALSKQASEVILATDPDREGEAIAWHLAKVLNLDIATNKRLEFHEITRDSITNALKEPRTINLNLVSSQETRRILDRIIGFKLSTLLYKKIHSRSGGRVQSATLKLIYDQEMEIVKFVPEEYWNILVDISFQGKDFSLNYIGVDGKDKDIKNQETADRVLGLIPSELRVKSVQKSIKTIEPSAPFTTSTMQQEAFSKLKFKTKKTQFVAQSLYEGVDVAGEHVGLITYMRTDSTRISPTFIARAKNYINEKFGEEYWGGEKAFKNASSAQDAHEAIRPTSNHRTPDSVRQYLTPEQYSLYKLIYNRALASLMTAKKEEVLNIVLEGNGVEFQFSFSRTIFKGFETLYKDNEKKDYFGELPNIKVGDKFDVTSKKNEQKFTQPPSRYSEAKVVKLMEEVGIGRPSTYASTIETLRKRKYVTDEKGILNITDQGFKTMIVLGKYFPDIINTEYTAIMEKQLDTVEAGSESRLQMLNNFYKPFIKSFDDACKKMYDDKIVYTGDFCPKCGKPLVVKKGKNGEFVGCSNFPSCDYIQKEKQELEYTGENCPKCGKPLVKRKDKKTGAIFVACSGYPKCKYIVPTTTENIEPAQVVKVCPKCGGNLVKKKGKYGYFLGCTNYPECNYMEKIGKKKRK